METENTLKLIDFRVSKTDSNGNIQEQIFGINVYKVKEVIFRPPKMSTMPNKSEFIEGIINLRGHFVPIINLQKRLGYLPDDILCDYFIISECNNIIFGFMVNKIMKIRQIKWEDVISPPEEIKDTYGDLITSMTIIENNEIMLILDFEKIIADLDENDANLPLQIETTHSPFPLSIEKSKTILCIDDSAVARNMIRQTLEAAGLTIIEAVNGIEGLQIIKKLSDEAAEEGQILADKVSVILCDIEMPLMDGFTFTKTIKANPLFRNVPVIIHSSLSKTILADRGKYVDADDYLTKFSVENLLVSIQKFL